MRSCSVSHWKKLNLPTGSIQIAMTDDDYIRKIISAIESSHSVDPDVVASAAGLEPGEVGPAIRKVFLEKGFDLRAFPNYARLGLSRVTAVLDVDRRFAGQADSILNGMAHWGYLVTWIKPLGGYRYVTYHAVPPSYLEDYRRLFDVMKEEGLLTGYSYYQPRSQPEAFSYDPSVFDYWGRQWKAKPENVEVDRVLREHNSVPFSGLDELDLKIVEQLQYSALRASDTMAREFGVPQEEVERHLQNHVYGEGLVLKVIVDVLDKEVIGGETGVLVCICSGGSEEGFRELKRWLLRNPNLQYLNAGSSHVEAHLNAPWRSIPFVGAVVDKKVSEVQPEVYELEVLSADGVNAFAIPLEQFKGGMWTFSQEEALMALRKYLRAP